MKQIVTIALMLVLFGINLYSQGNVTLQSGETTTFHKTVVEAYDAAKNGDVILVPGGNWEFPEIRKELTIIGAGYDPRYTTATRQSVVSTYGAIKIKSNNVKIQGFLINGSIGGIDFTDVTHSNCVISRCKFKTLNINRSTVNNLVIEECVFDNIYTNAVSDKTNNLMISNCFIGEVLSSMTLSNVNFENNVFFGDGVKRLQGCIFRNNIFTHWSGEQTSENFSSFINNIFGNGDKLPTTGGTIIGNKVKIPLADIFENLPTATPWTYSYDVLFNLKENSPAKNAGVDGTDCGVWGGEYPWKESAVPMLPHIKEMKISPQTKASGKLNVEFKVEAQGK